MNIKSILLSFIFFWSLISCSEKVLETTPTQTGQTNTPGLKSAYMKYYVATTGSDSNTGTLASPFLTIGKAVGVAVAGDSVFIRGGVYKTSVNISKSGTSALPINIQAYQAEVPVVAGNGDVLPSPSVNTNWTPIFTVAGNYINVKGIEVRNSAGMGVVVSGSYNVITGMHSHHNNQNGILVTGNNNIVQSSVVEYNCLTNINGASSNGWASGLSAARAPSNTTLRGNTVHDNWGEGLSSYEATNTLMEDNTVYNNYSVNIYISDIVGATCQRNFIYQTKNMTGGAQVGIMMGDEKNPARTTNVKVLYNIVYGCHMNLYWYNSAFTCGLNNVTWANNTLVNASTANGNLRINGGGTHVATIIENNTVYQGDSNPITIFGTSSPIPGITFSNNLWSKTPGSVATGLGDIIGDPKFTNLASPTTATSFALTSASPGINKGINTGCTIDYLKNTLVGLPDIGAMEYTSGQTTTTYYNTQISATATKNDCTTGSTGSTVTYTVAAGKYSSSISQADADSKASADLTANKQAYANANGTCTGTSTTYYSAQEVGTVTKNDCGTGYTGSTVTYTVIAGKYSSTVSQADANNKAIADVATNKQANANANGTCTAVTIYYNVQESGTATKNSCGKGYRGSTVTYKVAAGKYSSTISQTDANNLAITDVNNNKQAYANSNGTCTKVRWWQR